MLEKGFIETNLWRKTWQFFVWDADSIYLNREEKQIGDFVCAKRFMVCSTNALKWLIWYLLFMKDFHFGSNFFPDSCFEAIKFKVWCFWVFLGLETQGAHNFLMRQINQVITTNHLIFIIFTHVPKNLFSLSNLKKYLTTQQNIKLVNLFLEYNQICSFQILNSHASQSRNLFKLVYKARSFSQDVSCSGNQKNLYPLWTPIS